MGIFRLYAAPADWREVIRIAEELDDYTLDVMTPKIMGTYPNTYTFTKALAEQVIVDYSDKIPSVIFRPSIGKLMDLKFKIHRGFRRQKLIRQRTYSLVCESIFYRFFLKFPKRFIAFFFICPL